MTDRRGSVFLWIAYTLVFFICYFFAAGIFGRFALMGSVPNIIPVAIAMVAVLEGSFAGSIFGLCLGLFGFLAQGDTGPAFIFVGAVLGMLAGLLQRDRRRNTFGPCMLASAGSLFLVELVRVLTGLALSLIHIWGTPWQHTSPCSSSFWAAERVSPSIWRLSSWSARSPGVSARSVSVGIGFWGLFALALLVEEDDIDGQGDDPQHHADVCEVVDGEGHEQGVHHVGDIADKSPVNEVAELSLIHI